MFSRMSARMTFGWLFLVVLTAGACRFLFEPAPSQPPSDIPTPVLNGQSSSTGNPGGGAPPPTVMPPTSQPATPTPAGTTVTCPSAPIRLTIPQGLSWTSQCFQTTFGTMDSSQVITIWRFATSPADAFCEQGCVDVIPLAQAQAAFGQWVFPPEGQNAAVIFEAARTPLNFVSGQGTRTLEIQGQSLVMANNESLVYVFRGTTSNGQYAVYAVFPVVAAILPSTMDPAQNTNAQALQPLPQDITDMAGIEAYNQKAAQALSQQPPTAFTPRLDLLDLLIQSLTLSGTP